MRKMDDQTAEMLAREVVELAREVRAGTADLKAASVATRAYQAAASLRRTTVHEADMMLRLGAKTEARMLMGVAK